MPEHPEKPEERSKRFNQLQKEATGRQSRLRAEYRAKHPRRKRTRMDRVLETIQGSFCSFFKHLFFPSAP